MSRPVAEGCEFLPQICPSPIFIIGSPRSGTTALAWSLARHSQLWTSNESDFLYQLLARKHLENVFERARSAPGRRWLEREGVERDEFYAYLGMGLNALFTSRSFGKRWIDNTPRYTLVADELACLFPGAVFIHLLRDGRRVVSSMINFARAEAVKVAGITAKFIGPWATDFREASSTWRLHVETAAAFCEKHSMRSLTVQNERLIDNPQAGFAEILHFLKLENEPGPADYFRLHRVNSSFHRELTGPLSLQSFPNPWNEWSEEQRSIFVDEAAPTMIRFGICDETEFRPTGDAPLDKAVAEFCHVAYSVLPSAATVAIVSKGDDRLLKLHGRRAWHFPQDEEGNYLGHHPADSSAAIAQLNRLRDLGAEYLAFPDTSRWWLDHYVEFRQHLELNCSVLVRNNACTIYALNTAAAG
jgi:hypothetical protein